MEKLDTAILGWIAENTSSSELREQISQAKVARRDYMRTGFFVYFDLPEDIPPVQEGVRPGGPDILSAQLAFPAGSALFLRNGRLHYLEIFVRGGFFPQELDEFTLAAPE